MDPHLVSRKWNEKAVAVVFLFYAFIENSIVGQERRRHVLFFHLYFLATVAVIVFEFMSH